MTKREKISAICRALRAKTVENGCTEAEALAAAEKLADMLRDYNLTLDEIEMRASSFGKHTERHQDDVGERLWKVAGAIAELTGATYWTSAVGVHPIEINFFGFQHEVEVAAYLLDICARAMRQEHRRLQAFHGLLRPEARRRKVLPFIDGMADRLRQRILALKPPTPTGTGLVVLRNSLIAEAMALAGIKTKDRAMPRSRDFEAAYQDGRAAADRVSLNRGVSGSQHAQKQLNRH